MRPRETILYLLAAVATLTLLVCGCQESNQVDCQIVGHSMATTYKSEHSVVTCEHCGFKFACDVIKPQQSGGPAIICGNCAAQIETIGVSHSADQVKLTRGTPVKRWDVVAFQRGDRTLIKRVIGLPGEVVDFSAGNLLINGRIAPRPPLRWREVSTLVFDSKPEGASTDSVYLFERLVPRAKTNWSVSGTSIVHRAKGETNSELPNSEFDFLDYRHRRCYKSSVEPQTPVAIDDAYAFNQSIRRMPHRVDELDVSVNVSFADAGAVQLQRTTSKGTFNATVVSRDERSVAIQLVARSVSGLETVKTKLVKVAGRSAEVRLVNYDNWIYLVIDGNEYVTASGFESTKDKDRIAVDVSKPVISIGVSHGDRVTIERVSVWRDWYLFQESPKPSVRLPQEMGKRGYYVVGDNLPVSEDSRHFGIVHDIIGVVQPITGN